MKVSIVSYDFGEYCVRLASALARKASVQLLLPGTVAEDHLPELDPQVRFGPFDKPRLRQPGAQIFTALGLIRRIKEFAPDVVHVQHGHLWFNGFIPLLGFPIVMTVHDVQHHPGDLPSRKTPQTIMDFGFRRASRVVVHAGLLKDELVRRCAIPSERIDVVPHISLGGAPDAGAPSTENGPTVLFFGRIWEYKGLEYLIRAEPLITEKVPDVNIVIAGQGENFDRYRRMMVHPDRFTVYNEYISKDRCNDLFRQSSVVALPYIEASQSGVIPLAYGWLKPVVASAVGGLPEMIDEGRTGYLVPPRNERALADAIVRLLRDPRLRREMGMRGRTKLDAECGPDVVASLTYGVYERARRRAGVMMSAVG